mmetsp:Transcript_37060/g.72905  ORF Transcript_37060/g.72905 Transcript_37060/m.72905 type:complete len:82 (+) Transcript_37060:959-1204(+)
MKKEKQQKGGKSSGGTGERRCVKNRSASQVVSAGVISKVAFSSADIVFTSQIRCYHLLSPRHTNPFVLFGWSQSGCLPVCL